MGLMDKIKNIFTEEVEDEPIKKEMIQVEIPSPIEKIEKPTLNEEIEEVKYEPKNEIKQEVKYESKETRVERVEPKIEEEKVVKKEEKFVFPVYFDDKDFSSLDRKKEEKKPLVDSYKGKTQTVEKKIFKPTPIISPVYGILDKNYTKDDITSKNDTSASKKVIESIDVDSVRNKAYGSLQDEFEDALKYVEKTEPVAIKHDDMEEYRKKMEEVDLTMVNDVKMSDDFEEELKKVSRVKRDEDKPITESDLFNMIDCMYEEDK